MNQSHDDSSMLVVFCKRPALHVGKQRIAASLGPEKALQLSELLLAATLEDAIAWGGPVTLSPASADDFAWATRLLPDAHVVPQPPGNLGERINSVDSIVRADGALEVLYIGSDSPALDASYLRQAKQSLSYNDFALGPALDGGVTLMGSRVPWPDLEPLPWSSNKLCGALMALGRTSGLSIAELDRRFDVDNPIDLQCCWDALQDDPRPARQALCRWIHANQLHTG
jgi:glycosyltransferase A (GT-A) superfamily protein (DUF2064 family)